MVIPPTFLVLLVVTLVFGFLGGFHSSGNVVATVISSRAMGPRSALLLAGAAVFAGPFLFGVAVAETIGRDLVDPGHVTVPVIVAAVLAAIAWKLLTSWVGIPSSPSHALLGGLIGAVAMHSGVGVLRPVGVGRIVGALVLSPVLGLIAGYLTMNLVLFLLRGATPRVNVFFRRAQLFTAVALALGHGTNDAQKLMGIITLGMVTTGMTQSFRVPWWVVAGSAATMALGTLSGGQHVIKTIGARFYKIRPVHGFSAQLAAAAVIVSATLLGGPVSTTQVVSPTIVGVGSAERVSKVRWNVFYEVGLAWILTIPVTALLAGALYLPAVVLFNWLN